MRRTSWRAIRQQDILLHHPYQSFEPVVEFIRRAADDPNVVAIKQTVYRTGVNSVLMEALIEAAAPRQGGHRRGRADGALRRGGEHQLGGAAERAGAQVVYGVFGLKTHAKLALLIRARARRHRRVAARPVRASGHRQLSPAHDALYTDFGLLTADPDICADVNEVFLHITSLARAARMKRLLLAPFTMHRRVLR